MNVFDYRWDEDRCGYFVTIDGQDAEFFEAKSKWDRSSANDAAKKRSLKLRNEQIASIRQAEYLDIQLNKPLRPLELEWIELHKKLIAACNKQGEMSESEIFRYKQIAECVRKSILEGWHPAVKGEQ
jgi:hypothetical protein